MARPGSDSGLRALGVLPPDNSPPVGEGREVLGGPPRVDGSGVFGYAEMKLCFIIAALAISRCKGARKVAPARSQGGQAT
jgi:hypothetical protein